jgi:hypothetical protein
LGGADRPFVLHSIGFFVKTHAGGGWRFW